MNNETSVTLSSEELTAVVRPLGAQLIKLSSRSGVDLLWDGDPAYWPDHAPILFPVIGPLTRQRLRHRGRSFEIPPHGFAQSKTFRVVERGQDRCALEITDDAETRAMYPFSFRLRITYVLQDGTLQSSVIVTNTGDEMMPCDIGFHPGFRWPLDSNLAKDDYRIVFDENEPAPIRRGIDDPIFLHGEPHPTPIEENVLAIRDELFMQQAIVLPRINSRALTYRADTGPGLRIEFPDSPNLALWMRPGANFIAIEPWQGLPAEYGWDGEFLDKPGVAVIEPGATREWRLAVTLVES